MRSDLLHVIGVYFNPRRNPYFVPLMHEWIKHMLDSGVNLTMVEHAFGERPWELDPAMSHVNVVQVRSGSESELWMKEALIRIGLQRIPETAKYICWEDADIKHLQRDWAAEVIQMLQHHRVGQTWTHSVDLDAQGQIQRNEWGNDVDRSFSAAWASGEVGLPDMTYGFQSASPAAALLATKVVDTNNIDWRQHFGYSWAIRRDVMDKIGGPIDWMITGSADYHMALGFAGVLEPNIDPKATPGYARRLKDFARRCDDAVKQDIGVVPGTIAAGYHGPKKSRHYLSRQAIINESKFDPDKHLAVDMNGLPRLVGDNRMLRDGLRKYFTRRNEE